MSAAHRVLDLVTSWKIFFDFDEPFGVEIEFGEFVRKLSERCQVRSLNFETDKVKWAWTSQNYPKLPGLAWNRKMEKTLSASLKTILIDDF